MCRKVLSTGVIVLLIMTLTGVVNAAPGTGLVGYFKMNETTGDVAGDSVSGKDGFLDYGVNWSASGKLGGAADFATVDNKYNIIYADDITQQMSKTSGTVAVWMKQTSGATSARRETTRVLFDFNGGSGSWIQLWTADGSVCSTRLNLGLGY